MMPWKCMPIPAEPCPCGGLRAAWRSAAGQPSWTLWHASQETGATDTVQVTEDNLARRGLTLAGALADHVARAHLRRRQGAGAARKEETMSRTGPPPATLRGNCFVITGVLDGYTRSAACAALRLVGASHADEVGLGVDCLVVGDLPARYQRSGTSKQREAERLGIPIMDGDLFVERLNRERQVQRRAVQDEYAARARAARPASPSPPPATRRVDTPDDLRRAAEQTLGMPIVFAPPEGDDAPLAPPSPVAPPGVAPDAAAPPSRDFADLLADLNRPRKARP